MPSLCYDSDQGIPTSYFIVLYIQFPSTKPYGQAVTHLEDLVGESCGRGSVALLSNCAVTIIEEC